MWRKRFLLVILSLTLAAGCNPGIFVDAPELPDYKEVTIEGDGGSWECPFLREGLKRIYINYPVSDLEYVTYYGSGGITGPIAILPNSRASSLRILPNVILSVSTGICCM